ncbi:ATP-dependent DNA helicase II subunit 1 [Eremomyces bilateralis CBS 781.70]|uniref:ATP-dependent DNA helicase II subunit 1 n=1 Tax=Eremomyces bilateralis CBS 781.70 TaxID=1392243 RepID=A0A6G1G440_9PEZI|nr:ATP-dependent DNA helicase II subunit 1 [Eremomyces bilateralis CBS 781.70]KAF1812589.1 ATP-dependent DNA helicase II subunit 1 [Eremomyces bilateralis CBS 781.70]
MPGWTNDSEKRDGDEEEDEEVDDSGYKAVKDAVIFAIDVSPSMLKKPPNSSDRKADRDTAASAALKCAYQLMQQRIISHPHDMMGVLLFGTEESRFTETVDSGSASTLNYPHCYVLTDLDVPAAADVKKLKSLVEDEEEAEKFLKPSSEPVSMSTVLFCSNNLFTTKAANFASRRLFLVTDNDDPHLNDKALRASAAVRAKDLYDLGVVIELFPISRGDHTFDRTKFYDDIVYRPVSADPEAPAPIAGESRVSVSGDGITLLQSLLSNINSKAAPRRAQFTIPLELGPGLRIGVKGFTLIKRQEPVRSCYIWLSGEKPQIVTSSTTKIAEDTARAVDKSEIRKGFRFGGEVVSFTPEELAALKNFGDPIIRIIGFKSLDSLPFWAITRAPYFLYPTEEDFIGSTRVFSALHQKLARDKKFGLAWFIPIRNSHPRLAAIIAGEERLDEDGEQVMPPGLWAVPLPFADDIRQNPDTHLIRAPNKLIDLMRDVIRQLQLPGAKYDQKKYPNPSLQWFYKILQCLALDEDIPETPEDKTIPKYKQINKRAGDYVLEWGRELEIQYQGWMASQGYGQVKPPGKRIADRTAEKGPAKKIKAEDGGTTSSAMAKHFQKGTLASLTVATLKEFAAEKGIKVSGKKADIVAAVEEYFETKS